MRTAKPALTALHDPHQQGQRPSTKNNPSHESRLLRQRGRHHIHAHGKALRFPPASGGALKYGQQPPGTMRTACDLRVPASRVSAARLEVRVPSSAAACRAVQAAESSRLLYAKHIS